ncbi:MAG: MBL fold metallo-hydrolase [Pseudomonadota bacterium]
MKISFSFLGLGRMIRRQITRGGSVLGACAMLAACGASEPSDTLPPAVGFNAELAYFQDLNLAAPAEDPQVAALLMLEYQSIGRQGEGQAFFQELLDRHAGKMTPTQELVYLSALGILRAEAAENVPLLSRIEWVEETIEILERARKIGANKVFFSRFATAMVYARLPSMFDKQDQALEDFAWLVQNRDQAFQPGVMRLVYQTYANTLRAAGREEEARAILADARIEPDDSGLVSNFAVNPATGATFRPLRFLEIEEDKVYLVSGLDFTEYYFIISDDRRHLISVDAGVTPEGAKAAYDLLEANVPDVPPLTTVFITHSHWDHIGGHTFFRQMNPDVVFYGRDNYHEELANMEAGPEDPVGWFFGAGFSNALIQHYHPDVEVSSNMSVTIGGTRFQLLPAPGAETPDAMFIHMPETDMLFVGDFIMPFVGAPFIEEGSIDELISAIDMIAELAPTSLWHGHEPLTANWASPDRLIAARPHLVWLRDAVRARIQTGSARSDIHQENLIPPTLYNDPESQVIYLVMREQIINRIYDQSVGYWERDLTGLDHLKPADYGQALQRYFDLAPNEIEDAIEAMIEAGDNHLAERVVRWALADRQGSKRLRALQKQAALALRYKYQSYNPFKFILYSELADVPTAQLPTEITPNPQN